MESARGSVVCSMVDVASSGVGHSMMVNPCSMSPKILLVWVVDDDRVSDPDEEYEYFPRILPSKNLSSNPSTGE